MREDGDPVGSVDVLEPTSFDHDIAPGEVEDLGTSVRSPPEFAHAPSNHFEPNRRSARIGPVARQDALLRIALTWIQLSSN